VHGGYGYTRDYDVEQMYRDNRLNLIHEGTQGIQALDLLGRKVVMHDSLALDLLSSRVDTTLTTAQQSVLKAHADSLHKRWQRLLEVTRLLHSTGDLNITLANATLYLEAFGHLIISWVWLEQALTALKARMPDDDFYAGKLQAAKWFFRYELPRVDAQLDLLASLDTTTLEMRDSWF